MKKFTKGALITVLVFVILGFMLCAVGIGMGFHYTSIPKMISNGEFNIGSGWKNWCEAWRWNDWDDDWESWGNGTTESFDFSKEECAGIQNLKLLVECGIVEIEEARGEQEIHVEVKYRKQNTKRDISVKIDGNILCIEENASKRLSYNDNVRIVVQIPADMKFKEIELNNSAGEVMVNHALYAEDVSIIVGAGESVINETLQISGTLYAEVDAGEIDFAKINAKKIELNAGVGEIDVEKASADEVVLDCGVGEINITVEGDEEDYSYQIDCGIGEVEIADRSYSGLGTTKGISGGSKIMDIDCGVGEINVDFTR